MEKSQAMLVGLLAARTAITFFGALQDTQMLVR